MRADVLHLIFNYTPERGEKHPVKATLVSKLIHNEDGDFNPREGELHHINGFEVLIQKVEELNREEVEGRKVLAIAETIYNEDMYDEIVAWFIDSNWHVEDALQWYDTDE